MPRLSDTMEEGVVAKWLKSVGDKIEEGDILAEIETDKATMEFESFHEGTDTMTDGTVATWLKKKGETVTEGDILAEIETDKATMEFESFYEGTILHIGVNEGETAPVDSLLTIIGPKGTDVSAIVDAHASGNLNSDTPKSTSSSKSEEKKVEEKVKETASTNSNVTTNNSGGRIFASPLAKKIASDKGINLADVSGSGENGRIIKKDVENFTPSAKPVEIESSTSTQPQNFIASGKEHSEEIKNSQMRKAIAKSLGNSKFSAPDFSLNIEVDMDNAMASRKTINAIPDTKVSFNDMV
eukprot:maker-scaffold3129_size10076-snap-gene-0.0 protein:Tk05326 transcript:maker-scaffold3129_size10076-snap-gene-0.0-mRNA-1 annotation:"pyruvate dehydrogenase"